VEPFSPIPALTHCSDAQLGSADPIEFETIRSEASGYHSPPDRSSVSSLDSPQSRKPVTTKTRPPPGGLNLE